MVGGRHVAWMCQVNHVHVSAETYAARRGLWCSAISVDPVLHMMLYVLLYQGCETDFNQVAEEISLIRNCLKIWDLVKPNTWTSSDTVGYCKVHVEKASPFTATKEFLRLDDRFKWEQRQIWAKGLQVCSVLPSFTFALQHVHSSQYAARSLFALVLAPLPFAWHVGFADCQHHVICTKQVVAISSHVPTMNAREQDWTSYMLWYDHIA